MVYKALLWTDVFWVSYIKWYKFYNNDLSAVLGRKQGGTLKFVNPKHKDWALIHLLTLSVLTFLFTLPRCQAIFQWKQTKVRKCLKCVKESSRRFDLANGKYLSIFLRFLQELPRSHILLKLSIFERSNKKRFSREKSKTNGIAWIFFTTLSHA